MNRRGVFQAGLMAYFAIFHFQTNIRADSFPMTLRPNGPTVELSWTTAMTNAPSNQMLPEYEVQYSTDLKNWKPIGGKVRGISGLSGPRLSVSLERQPGPLFYRVIASPLAPVANETGDGGADVFGFNA